MDTVLSPPNFYTTQQAINAIRGYEYQILNAALEWVDLPEECFIYLEVAEDYAHVVKGEIEAVQVKETRGSGSVTLNTPAILQAIESLIVLVACNPKQDVRLRFLTTSSIGREKAIDDRPCNISGLEYWKLVSAGKEDVSPLREILERESTSRTIREYCESLSDEELRANLIQKITWDCNKPDSGILQQELEARVGLFLQREFDVPIQEALKFTDVVVTHVLHKSAQANTQDRVLTHKELRQLADANTRVSLSRRELNHLLARSSPSLALLAPVESNVSIQNRMHPPWIGDAESLAVPKVLIHREQLEQSIKTRLKNEGICFVVGPTGTGKSILTMLVASKFPDRRYWVDLRDIKPMEARNRLKQVFVLLAELCPATLMLEDLNCLADRSVQVALNEVIEVATRRDMRIVITGYENPTASTLNVLGTDTNCVVTVPKFREDETLALIEDMGGNPNVWGRLAYTAGGEGHPQLTYAFVAGLASRNWPENEFSEILSRGFTNADLEEEHSAVRANISFSLTKSARELLSRLSITIAPFERSLALEISAITPAIENASESLDELVDRWLEPALGGGYRKSPLIHGLGRMMLTVDQQREVHKKIAVELCNRNLINVSELEAILVHGLAGESPSSLSRVACAIYMADEQTRQTLAKHLTVFLAFDTSKPVYAKDPSTSVLLRIAQLRLVIETEERCGIADITEALLLETSAIPNKHERRDLEIAVLWFILSNQGIASDLDNWVYLLERFRRVSDKLEGAVMGDLQISPATVLFSFGIIGLGSVKRLESIFYDLSELDATQRKEYFTSVDSRFDVYQVLVDQPLNIDSSRPNFDAIEAVNSYKRIASETDSWGIPKMSILCRIVEARIMAEHLSDTNGALSVIQEAQDTFGTSPLLDRAIAMICLRSGRNSKALLHFGKAIEQIETFGPVDAVYMARDAAICAAEREEWTKVRDWFLLAQTIADPLKVIDGGATRVGFGADAAVASFRAGDLKGALRLLMEALHSLQEFEPDSNLQAAHCHRLVRHTILWLWAKVDKLDSSVTVHPSDVPAGACSNPNPIPEIEQHPLGHIEFAWYLLSEIEFFSDLSVGVQDVVRQFGDKGYIPFPENMFRTQTLEVAIAQNDPKRFSEKFADYLVSASYCLTNKNTIRSSFSALNPQRVVFPLLPTTGPYDSNTVQLANNAILFYGFRSVFRRCGDSIKSLRDSLVLEFSDSFPGCELLDYLDGTNNEFKDPNHQIATILKGLLKSKHAHPTLVFRTALVLPKWIVQSFFKFVLISKLKPWLIEEWRRIVNNQRFLLRSPYTSIPQIMQALNSELDGERFAAHLTLASESAFGSPLNEETRQYLRGVVYGS